MKLPTINLRDTAREKMRKSVVEKKRWLQPRLHLQVFIPFQPSNTSSEAIVDPGLAWPLVLLAFRASAIFPPAAPLALFGVAASWTYGLGKQKVGDDSN